jgi:hypothetical protein
MLDRPGALEDEIAAMIVERAGEHARALFATEEPAPEGDDLYTRAVRGVLTRFVAARDAERAAQRMAEAIETDTYLRRLKAGEDIE